MAGAMIYILLYNNWLFWFSFGVLNCSASELGTLRSLNASAKQSTTFQDRNLQWKASWAVDGSNRTDSGKCQCCSATVFQTNPWLQIDLGRYYRLGSFEVFARSDGIENVWGMDVFFTKGDNWSNNYEGNITLPTNNRDVRYFNTTLADPVIARYVTMVLPRYDALIVCEVNIYSKDCQAGTYGLYCNETCGRCQGSDICDFVFGNCSRCEPGYIGTNCKTECPERNFGQNCSSLCHCHGNQTCNRVNGSCPGDRCDLGWRGSNCSNECEPGTYGENCLQTCGHCHLNETCDRRTGSCTLCSSGYTGIKCDADIIPLSAAPGVQVSMSSIHAGMDATKAIDGQLVGDPETCGCCSQTTIEYSSWWQVDLGRPYFLKKVIVYGRLNENIFRQLMGFSILTSLTDEFPDKPVHIQNGEIQDSKVLVLLPDVAARYVRIQRLGILTICEVELVQSDIICPTYTYGRSCAECGPCKNGSCDPVTGYCPSGCYDGYGGNRCEKLTVHKSTDNDVINGVIGAGVGVVTSLFVVALIVALFRYKERRIHLYEEPSVSWSKEPTKESAYATLENQEIVIKKEETYVNAM